MTEWKNLKSINRFILKDLYAKSFTVTHEDDGLAFLTNSPILRFVNPKTLEYIYWRLECFEDEEGDDHLLIYEQNKPDPLKYIKDQEVLPEEHIVDGSHYYFKNNLIMRVYGYGFKNTDVEILQRLVFELDHGFVVVEILGNVLSITTTKQRREQYGKVIFTM